MYDLVIITNIIVNDNNYFIVYDSIVNGIFSLLLIQLFLLYIENQLLLCMLFYILQLY